MHSPFLYLGALGLYNKCSKSLPSLAALCPFLYNSGLQTGLMKGLIELARIFGAVSKKVRFDFFNNKAATSNFRKSTTHVLKVRTD
jgi:hypothetical protein